MQGSGEEQRANEGPQVGGMLGVSDHQESQWGWRQLSTWHREMAKVQIVTAG